MTFHPFMRLPPELRVRIYDMVVVFDEPIFISRIDRGVWHSMERSTTRSGRSVRPEEDENEELRRNGHSALAVVHTCRQVYLEAAPRYYCLNTFAVYLAGVNSSSMQAFSADVGPIITEMIAKLELYRISGRKRAHVKKFKGCRTLTVPLGSLMEVPSASRKAYMQKWFGWAKSLCNALKKLERVHVKTYFRRPKVGQYSTQPEQERKAAEVELNLVLHTRKQLQE